MIKVERFIGNSRGGRENASHGRNVPTIAPGVRVNERTQTDDGADVVAAPASPGRRRGRRRERATADVTPTAGAAGSMVERGGIGPRLPLDARLTLVTEALGEVVARLDTFASTVDVALDRLADHSRLGDTQRRELLADTASLMVDLVSPRFTTAAVQLGELTEAQLAAVESADARAATQLDEMRAGVEGLSGRLVREVRAAAGPARSLLGELDRALTTAVTQLTSRLDQLGERADQLEQRLAGATETTAQTLTGRLHELDQRAGAMQPPSLDDSTSSTSASCAPPRARPPPSARGSTRSARPLTPAPSGRSRRSRR